MDTRYIGMLLPSSSDERYVQSSIKNIGSIVDNI